jgi:hypothetical protein
MLDNLPSDPEVARIRSELQASLANMAAGMARLTASLEARGRLAPESAAATITFRVDHGLETRLARFMRQSGITNQARAIRLLMAMALTTAGVRE